MKLSSLHRLAKPGLPVATMLAVLAGVMALPLSNAAEPVPSTTPLITLSDLMEAVLNPAAGDVWNTALIEPAAGADKPVLTDEQWLNLRYNALRILTVPPVLMHPDLQIAAPGTVAPDGELQPDAIAALLKEKADAWRAQVSILQQGAQATLAAIDAKDLDATLQAGDAMYGVCESCHMQFWYPPAN